MSKPILSELEYNASDVASAILNNADLAIANEDLGVTDRSSDFSVGTGWAGSIIAYSFNGFMFVNSGIYHAGTGQPAHGETMFSNSETTTRPNQSYTVASLGYQADSAVVEAKTDGTFTINDPDNQGISNFYATVNFWYRF